MRLTDAPPIPKYWQLAEHFRQQVMQGVLKPGDRLPSLSEMQAAYNASRPTVERAHALLEKEGLIVRRHGAGVFVCEPQRKTVHDVIGLSGDGFNFRGNSSYWSQIMGGVREAASRAGQQLLLLDEHSSASWQNADGVILCDWAASDASRYRTAGQPLVSLFVPIAGVSSVVADDYDGARRATEYLVGLGHRKIGFLYSNPGQPIIKQRLAGYRKALQATGIKPQAKWRREMKGGLSYGEQIVASGRAEMQRWIESDWKQSGCTALLCHNDEIALGAIQALQASGIRIPEDVSVVGYDGTELCDLTSPTLAAALPPL